MFVIISKNEVLKAPILTDTTFYNPQKCKGIPLVIILVLLHLMYFRSGKSDIKLSANAKFSLLLMVYSVMSIHHLQNLEDIREKEFRVEGTPSLDFPGRSLGVMCYELQPHTSGCHKKHNLKMQHMNLYIFFKANHI